MTDAEYRKFLRKAGPKTSAKPALLPNRLGQYGEFALAYWKNGLKAVPATSGRPIVAKATGHEGTVTLEKVTEWVQHPSYRFAHVSLRAEGWVGIDVDDYNGKQGAAQLAALEATLGALPDTYTSTSRGRFSRSRQYFYQVPDDVPRKSKAARDIEIIQRCHRNAAVYPTCSQKTGAIYRWYQPDGKLSPTLPSIDDFPPLPDAWLEFLARDSHSSDDFSSHELFRGDLTPWAKWLGDGEPSEAYLELAKSISEEPHIGHDLLGHYLREIHRYRLEYEESGGLHALAVLYERYLETTNHPDPDKEWDDWVRWVVGADWSPSHQANGALLSTFFRWAKRMSGGLTNA